MKVDSIMEQPIVDTDNGRLRGCVKKNLDNEDFYCFFGVPYIKPALGNLRFKAPQPADSWTGIKDAMEERPPFIQKDNITQTVIGVEDAGHLNIFTKKLSSENAELLPVMVWIHGGAFTEGRNSTCYYGPDFLLIEDVVLVTVNYRLGFLGYFNFEDPSLEVYGNAALKDLLEALKWIQKNIQNFSGDRHNVTVFGQSAGACATHYLMMNPSSTGLIHKVIMQSGMSQAFWAKGCNYTKDFMKFIEKEHMSETEFLEYLRSLNVNELFDHQAKYFANKSSNSLGIIGPIEEIPNETAFMTKYPLEDIISGKYNKIPMMLGYTSNECIFFGSSIGNIYLSLNEFYDVKTILSAFDLNLNEEVVKKLNNKLEEIYPNEEDIFLKLTDLFLVLGSLVAAKKHSETSDKPVYLYRISLDAGLNFFKRIMKLDNLSGASHSDCLGYLFSNDLLPAPVKGTLEDISVRRFVKLWTNFAKYGNPTPEESELGITWKPFQNKERYFLDIDKDLTVQIDPENERIKVWREIFQMFPETAQLW